MEKNYEKIVEFYNIANKLKNVIRTGWQELEVSSPRLESVAEHVYGTLILTIGIQSERNLDLDMLKVFKMIVIKELEKVNLKVNSDKEFTPRSYPTVEERKENARNTIATILDGLTSKEEIFGLFEEFQTGQTEEAKFVKMVSTLESDLQAKKYDLDGYMDLESAKKDCKECGGNPDDVKKPSDGFINYNKKYYKYDEYFIDFSNYVQSIDDYTKIESNKR